MELRFNRSDILDVVRNDKRLQAGTWFDQNGTDDCPGCLVGRTLLRVGIPLNVAHPNITPILRAPAAPGSPAMTDFAPLPEPFCPELSERIRDRDYLSVMSYVFEVCTRRSSPEYWRPSPEVRTEVAGLLEKILPETFSIVLPERVVNALPEHLRDGIPAKVAAEAFVEAVLATAPTPAPTPAASTETIVVPA
jgi:hypothetical protein